MECKQGMTDKQEKGIKEQERAAEGADPQGERGSVLS